MLEAPHNRLGVYALGGAGVFGRSADANAGYSFGGELAYVFRGSQGIRVGYSYGVGVFGPEVHAFDVAYSYQWNTHPHIDGVTLSFGLLFGPSLGIVSYDGNQPDVHATFGGRAGSFFDVNIWMLTVGVDGGYRFGFSNPYGAESYATLGLHLGITLELPRGRNPYGT